MPHISSCQQVDPFVRANIYLICQRARVWLRLNPENEVDQELFNNFITFAYHGHAQWLRKTSQASRAGRLRTANDTIFNWLQTNYPSRRIFEDTDHVIYSGSLVNEVPRSLEVSDAGCELNRGTCVECAMPCPTSQDLCENQESQKNDFNWRELFSVVFINRDVGSGVVAIKDLEVGSYLGTVAGIALTKAESDGRHAAGEGRYLFKVARDPSDKIYAIDPLAIGNYSRFFNHSCKPSMHMEHWSVGNKYAIKFYASRAIACVSYQCI